ncbi:hypothetical protein SC171_05510 [Pantoea cypripedii]|uniref:hypothetical protein n=1 Tax=Pantoea cypripedii TaxID=55209 RepID=UPI002FC862AC
MNIASEFDIFPPFEALYIDSMLWHTNSALDAIKCVGDWIELIVADDKKSLELSKEKLFEQLQLIIQHAASLSKYLWPIRGGENSLHQRRGKKIRTSLKVDDSSALKCRKLRDGLEHFDEKLDKYLLENQTGEFQPYNVQFRPSSEDIPTHIFKGFYINNRVFVLLGNEYELLPIVSEIEHIHDSLVACVNAGYRFPRM